MPNYSGEIGNFAVGDDIDIVRTLTNIPVGQTISEATLTVKLTESASTYLFQLVITPSLSSSGIIDGSTITFTVSKSNTALLSAGNYCYYDIQVTTNAGKVYTPEKGRIKAEIGIT